MRPLSGILIVGVVVACSVGPRPDKFPPAREPAGATIQLRLLGKRVVTGELLAVQDSGLLVRDASRILLVPNRAVQSGSLARRRHGRLPRQAGGRHTGTVAPPEPLSVRCVG